MFRKTLSILFILYTLFSNGLAFAEEKNFSLIDQNGSEVEDSAFRGKIMMVYFGSSHHGEDCVQALKKMGNVISNLGENANKVQPIFISIDPAHDTPAALKKFMKSFDKNIVALTGDKKAIDAVINHYQLYTAQTVNKVTGSTEITDHERSYFFHDAEGVFVGNIASEAPVDDIVAAIKEFTQKNSGSNI